MSRGQWQTIIAVAFGFVLAGAACGGGGGGGGDGARPDEVGVDPSNPSYARAKTHHAAAQAARDGADFFEQQVSASAADPLGATMADLRARDGIAAVELSIDQATILVTTADGLVVSILTDQKDRVEWQRVVLSPSGASGAAATVHPLAESDDGSIICDPKNFPQSKRACVVTAFDSDFGLDTSTIKAPLTRAGYAVESLGLRTAADLQRLRQTLPSCGVIYFSTHGNVASNFSKTKGNNLATQIELDPKNFGDSFLDMVTVFGPDLEKHVSVTGSRGKVYWSLTPAFFAQFTYPNSFVFADVCNSARSHDGTTLANAFLEHGAGAFVGWEGPISTKFSNPVAKALFEGLAPATAAVDSVKISTDPPDPGARESYVPRVTVSPATAGVEIRLSISGTDGFQRSEVGKTDASGTVTFSTVPGGAGGVEDTISAVVGGANNSATVLDVVKNSATLNDVFKLPYNPAVDGTLSKLSQSAVPGFNLICNNQNLTKTTTIVKF